MATQKPTSNISYNSEGFLRQKLEGWVKAHIIQSYMYICHKGEDGDKDHIHLRIEPNRRIDVMELTDALKEHDPLHPDKPLGVMNWRPSVEVDWLLYVVHEPRYLAMKYAGAPKGEKLPYKWQDIKCSDDYPLEEAYLRAMASLEHTSPNLAHRLANGENPLDMVLKGENPFLVRNLMTIACAPDSLSKLSRELDIYKDRVDALVTELLQHGFVASFDKNNELHVEPLKDVDRRRGVYRSDYGDVLPFDDDLDL